MRFKARPLQFLVMILAALTAAPVFAQNKTLQIVGFGDSLMAGYQLAPAESYTAQLEAALKAKGLNVAINNAGVSGDTSSGGLGRIDWSVPDGTDGVILELGANDALRGIAPEQTEKNLDAMITRLKARNIAIYLVGIMAPPNMGSDYAQKFNPIYERLAKKHALPLYPFFLDGVAGDPALNQPDGIHPNARGVAVVVGRILPAVETLLYRVPSG